MSKILLPKLNTKKSLIDLPFFKDQISFHTKTEEKEFKSIKVDSELLKGLFKNQTTQQLHDIYEQLVKSPKKNVILELPLYAGKTLISFSMAYHYAHNFGKNAVIIYPSVIQRDIAFELHKKHLAEKYFNRFPNFIMICNEDDLKTDYLFSPQIYITDIFSLHKFFIHAIREEIFWEQFQLCVLEDCNNYTEVFGSNSAYVIRRLLSKLDTYNKEYQLLCTTKPINNRIEYISKLTGVNEFGEVVNIDSAKIPQFEVYNWYPPIEHVNYDSSGFKVKRVEFGTELKNLIQGLLATNSKENFVAILWEKYLISTDDIADLKGKFGIKEEFSSNIIIGNNFNEIRLNLLQNSNKLDFSDLSSILIVGNIKPLRFYLTDLMHIGISPKQIYFFDIQSPSLQYQIIQYLRNPKEIIQFSQTEKTFALDLSDKRIIQQHWNFLNDEQAQISSDILKKYFPDIFTSTVSTEKISKKSNYLILNKELKFLPKEKRVDEQLQVCSKYTFFSLILVESSQSTEVGKLIDYEVRAKCYPKNIIVFNRQNYFIKNVDWINNKVYLEMYKGNHQLVHRLSNYFGFTFDEGYNPTTSTQLNNRVFLIRGIAQISEQILNLKTTQNFEDYSTAGIPYNNSFENARLNYIEFRFPLELFQRFYPPDENNGINQDQGESEQEQAEQNNEINEDQRRNRIYESLFPILHTFAHLLIESIRVNNVIPMEEIKLFIPSMDELLVPQQSDDENDPAQPEWLYCSIYLIDLTNKNIDLLDSLYQNDLKVLLKIVKDILTQCPCEVGSNTCIKVDYCNIENCGILNQQGQPGQRNQRYIINADNSITDTVNRLNKINTLRFICDLLDDNEQVINTFVRWKRAIPERNVTSCIFENNKLQEMVKTAQLILTSKGMIQLNNFFRTRFFEEQEIRAGGPLGLTLPNTQEIIFRPGLTENELYETIFHEYFHNYEFDNINKKNESPNIHPTLSFFDWDNIDNPNSIPYMGLLVVEGAAVWFSLRMMEIFSDFSYLQYMTRDYTRFMEYWAGIKLMIEVERTKGYKNVFSLLKKSFDINDYVKSYIEVINEERRIYLNRINQNPGFDQNGEDQQNPVILPGLWCLQNKGQLNNINRITYLLRINIEPGRNNIGISEMCLLDKRVEHIQREEIVRLANLPTDQFIQDAQIIQVLNKYELRDMSQEVPEGNRYDGFICEGCASNCNLFTVCMLNGGRNIFREILLVKFPPQQPNSNPSLLRRIYRFFRRIFRRN